MSIIQMNGAWQGVDGAAPIQIFWKVVKDINKLLRASKFLLTTIVDAFTGINFFQNSCFQAPLLQKYCTARLKQVLLSDGATMLEYF